MVIFFSGVLDNSTVSPHCDYLFCIYTFKNNCFHDVIGGSVCNICNMCHIFNDIVFMELI